jgi:hypothetical protein
MFSPKRRRTTGGLDIEVMLTELALMAPFMDPAIASWKAPRAVELF